jgi:pimeloyl-ACP methyl ester carboxylesterase
MRFVLVHGGNHGPWCWERVIPEIERRGHTAVAVELPGHGTRVQEPATLQGYRDAVLEAVQPGDVLVGHSMGGYVISVAADEAASDVRHLVYLAAGLPVEGLSMLEASGGSNDTATDPSTDLQVQGEEGGIDRLIRPVAGGGAFEFRSAADAIWFFYHDCSPADAQWAASRLTPQPLAPATEQISIPRFWEAELPRSFIKCRQDRALNARAADRFIARLGVDPFMIDTAHSPFLNQPGALTDLLVEAPGRPPVGKLSPH